MQLKINLTHPDAITPKYATEGASAFDLYAADCGEPWKQEGLHNEFDTGVTFEVPDGYVLLVASRSGFGFNHGATLVNGVGIIDSDYRGTVKVKYTVGIPAGKGERIAQGLIVAAPRVEFVEGELSVTERGENGLGSTGV